MKLPSNIQSTKFSKKKNLFLLILSYTRSRFKWNWINHLNDATEYMRLFFDHTEQAWVQETSISGSIPQVLNGKWCIHTLRYIPQVENYTDFKIKSNSLVIVKILSKRATQQLVLCSQMCLLWFCFHCKLVIWKQTNKKKIQKKYNNEILQWNISNITI